MRTVQTTLIQTKVLNLKDKELESLLLGRTGGRNSARIIDAILKRPYNKNQLAKLLKVDYNTINHHISIISSHDYIIEEKFGNSYYYYPSEKLYNSIEEYRIIRNTILKEEKTE